MPVSRPSGKASAVGRATRVTKPGARRQVAANPIETYSDDRIREFEEANTIPAAMARRVQAHLKKKRAKK